MRIFVSIASYKDPELNRTIKRIYETANKPYRVYLGIVNQDIPSLEFLKLMDKYKINIKFHLVDPKLSMGVCWARALVMSLYEDQEYYFQIDSHTDFDYGWDDILIEKLKELDLRDNGVLSCYPPGYIFENNEYKKIPIKNTLFHKVKTNQRIKENDVGLHFTCEIMNDDKPQKGYHVGCNFLFTTGNFVKYFPYDPEIYFIGEEQSMACRLFTKGWDIYHIGNVPIYHFYNSSGNLRPLHWNEEDDKLRAQRWWLLENRSKIKLSNLLHKQIDYSIFGLGNIRSMGEYTELSGIDYKNLKIKY